MTGKPAGEVFGGKPLEWWHTPLGYRQDGRPIYPIGGGAPDDEDDDDDADLDDDPDDDGTDDDGDDGDELTDSEKKVLKALGPQLQTMGQSIADRLVNAQKTAERKAARDKERNGRTAGRSGASTARADRLREEQERETKADIRDGRLAFKDAFGDSGVRLSSVEERKTANELGRALVESAVRNGVDPDDAGADAAKTVAEVFRSARKTAEQGVFARLEKQGVDIKALQGSSGKGRQSSKGPQKTALGASVRAGEERAKMLVPGRVAEAPAAGK